MTAQQAGGPQGPPPSFRQWLALALGMGGIALFVFVAAPAVRDHTGIRSAVEEIQQRDIEAGAYFYTGVEQVRDAELFIRHAREYPAGQPDR